MTISVAMCTYNGARYLREQLESFAVQTRRPDELIVCDDRSSDESLSILEQFAARAPFPVRIFVNDANLGSTQNFARAIGLCSGDLIFLSDQDDVWHAEKLQKMEDAFQAQPHVGLLFTDAHVVDDQLQVLGSSLWTWSGFTVKRQRKMKQGGAFDLLLDGNVATGATMGFLSRLTPYILPIPQDLAVLYHDAWIALVAAGLSEIAFLPEPLIEYRQHAHQHVGVWREPTFHLLSKDHYTAHIKQHQALQTRLMAAADQTQASHQVQGNIRNLSARIAHLQARVTLPPPKWRRLPSVLRELLRFRYHRYSRGLRSAARDLFY